MIYFNGNITQNKYYSDMQQYIGQSTSSFSQNNHDKDNFVIQEKNIDKTRDNSKKHLLPIIGGVIIAAGLIFAFIKYKKGKNLTEHNNLDIAGTKNITQNASNIDPSILEIEKKEEKIKQKMNQLVENFIVATKPEDEQIVREALPKLIEFSEKLEIGKDFIKNTNNFISQITPKNKDFAINEGIPLVAENMKKINSLFNEPEKSYELLGALTPENKDYLDILLDKSKVLNIHNTSDLNTFLKKINSDNSNLIINDIIPAIEKNPADFKWFDGWFLDDFTEILNKGNKNEILNDTLPSIIKNSENLMLKNDASDVITTLKVINSKNKNYVFDDLLPHLIKNSENYKVKHSEDLSALIQVITPEKKDFAINKVLPILIKHNEALHLNNSYNMAKIIENTTPDNIDCIPLIAENINKLGLYDFWNTDDLIKLLNKGKENILKEINSDHIK